MLVQNHPITRLCDGQPKSQILRFCVVLLNGLDLKNITLRKHQNGGFVQHFSNIYFANFIPGGAAR